MEENGGKSDWSRGLAHAHNLNTLNRLPLCVERCGTANVFQAWDMQLVWDQGCIHFTPERIFFQPSYYVERMFADEWMPLVVQAECTAETLDVLAKKKPQRHDVDVVVGQHSEHTGRRIVFSRWLHANECESNAYSLRTRISQYAGKADKCRSSGCAMGLERREAAHGIAGLFVHDHSF